MPAVVDGYSPVKRLQCEAFAEPRIRQSAAILAACPGSFCGTGFTALRAGGYRGERARTFWLYVTVLVLAAVAVGMRIAPNIQHREGSASWQALATPNAVYYPNCDAARATGAAPIHRGQPGYRPQLDADSDGIACEPYRY